MLNPLSYRGKAGPTSEASGPGFSAAAVEMRAHHRIRTDISAVARRGSAIEPGRRIATAGIAPAPLAYQASALLLSYAAVVPDEGLEPPTISL